MLGQDEAMSASSSAKETMALSNEDSSEPKSGGGFLVGFALLTSAALWPFLAWALWAGYFYYHSIDVFFGVAVLVPIGWLLPPLFLLLRAGRWFEALRAIALLPAAILVNYLTIIFLFPLLRAVAGHKDLEPLGLVVIDAIPATIGMMLALRYCRRIPSARPEMPRFKADIHWRKIGGLALMFAIVLVLSISYLRYYIEMDHRGYLRGRVSELILAGSSAKTGLSEGMQTYGSWSADWMSAITISATGMVSSASIGQTGVITVYGTKPTSGAVVTMIPRTTTDNKLVWSCTGSPAKYMPASCR